MGRIAVSLALLALAGCASQPRPRYGSFFAPVANPGKVVATELAFARGAQDDGQWTAFANYSTDDAIMFVPEAVNAHDWLKGRANPPQAVTWQPHEVWSSCDGSLAVTRGAWQRANGTVGYFTTVWQRQEDGEYRWVMDQGDVLAEAMTEPEFVKTTVAKCEDPDIVGQMDGTARQYEGVSKDRTLWWHVNLRDDNARDLKVYVNTEEGMAKVLDLAVAAPE